MISKNEFPLLRISREKAGDGSNVHLDKRCIICGEESGEDRIVCAGCRGRGIGEVSFGMDSITSLIILLLLFSLLILSPVELVESEMTDELRSLGNIGLVMLFLSLLLSIFLLVDSRGVMIHKGSFSEWIAPVSIPLFVTSLIVFTTGIFDPLVMIPSLTSSLVFASLIFFKRGGLLNLKRHHLLLFVISLLIFSLGSIRSVSGESGSLTIWILTPPVITIIGFAAANFIWYLINRDHSITSRWVIPKILLFAAFSTSLLSLLPFYTSVRQSETTDILSMFSLLLLSFTAVSTACSRWTDMVMSRHLRDLKKQLKRAENLLRDGNKFYSLQLIDKVIEGNPVDGLGTEGGTSNIIFRLEGKNSNGKLIHESGDYEVSFNEKGKLLSSQGKYPEASKQFLEATKRDSRYLESYKNLSAVLSAIPGKDIDASRNLEFLIASKEHYLRLWTDRPLPEFHIRWMEENLRLYEDALRSRIEILKSMTRDPNLMTYFSLDR